MALKSIDAESNRIGTGVNHMLTSTFFDSLHNELKRKLNLNGRDEDLFKR